ncbi:hypothetical protein AMK26_26045 [Streptomyces sp. CB03234]|nr:hypothetical protein AMK26_26045 [Streptomyces sp. CB03234]
MARGAGAGLPRGRGHRAAVAGRRHRFARALSRAAITASVTGFRRAGPVTARVTASHRIPAHRAP